MMLFAMVATSSFAASHSNKSTRFEAFGVVSKANSGKGTFTITVNRASKGLQNKFGRNVTFHTSSAARINTCATHSEQIERCWKQLSENINKPGREAERGEKKLNLSQMKDGDWVFVSGYFDKHSGRFVADAILKSTT